jgi:hypothetical protein
MTDEQRLIEKLQLIEALFAGAATPGEREAAAQARERIRARLRQQQLSDPPVEYVFTLQDVWSRQLMIALMRRYDLRPIGTLDSGTQLWLSAFPAASLTRHSGRNSSS